MIYLFDENEKLFKILKKESLKSADQTYSLTTENYVSDRLTIETKGMNAGEVEKAHFMAIQSVEDGTNFIISSLQEKKPTKPLSWKVFNLELKNSENLQFMTNVLVVYLLGM